MFRSAGEKTAESAAAPENERPYKPVIIPADLNMI